MLFADDLEAFVRPNGDPLYRLATIFRSFDISVTSASFMKKRSCKAYEKKSQNYDLISLDITVRLWIGMTQPDGPLLNTLSLPCRYITVDRKTQPGPIIIMFSPIKPYRNPQL